MPPGMIFCFLNDFNVRRDGQYNGWLLTSPLSSILSANSYSTELIGRQALLKTVQVSGPLIWNLCSLRLDSG